MCVYVTVFRSKIAPGRSSNAARLCSNLHVIARDPRDTVRLALDGDRYRLAAGLLSECDKLLEHELPRGSRQLVDVGRSKTGRRDGVENYENLCQSSSRKKCKSRPLTLDRNAPGIEDEALDPEDVAVVGHDNGDDGDLGLDSEMEGTLLEGEQHGLLGVAASALGEHVDTLLPALHLIGGAAHGRAGILAIGAVEEDGTAKGHKPAEEGSLLERGLGGDAAVPGKHGAKHEDVQLGLMVAQEDGRAHRVEMALRVLDNEGDTSTKHHDIVEDATDKPLGKTIIADQLEEYRGEDTSKGDNDERHVRGQGAGHEGRLGHDCREHVEGERQTGVANEEVGRIAKDGRHCKERRQTEPR